MMGFSEKSVIPLEYEVWDRIDPKEKQVDFLKNLIGSKLKRDESTVSV
jgi:hypothetical protein